MKLGNRGNQEKPAWLNNTREVCHRAGIEIMPWGSNMLVVEAKSPGEPRKSPNNSLTGVLLQSRMKKTASPACFVYSILAERR
jgi:hypothetical protein